MEIVKSKQVEKKNECTATLITLLADREVQSRPWEGNYSYNAQRADRRERERERERGRGRGRGGGREGRRRRRNRE